MIAIQLSKYEQYNIVHMYVHMYDYRLVYLMNKNLIHTVYINPSIHM